MNPLWLCNEGAAEVLPHPGAPSHFCRVIPTGLSIRLIVGFELDHPALQCFFVCSASLF